MKYANIVKISCILTALSGCATQNDVPWRPYKDIDGKIKEVSFTSIIPSSEINKPWNERDLTQFQGYAEQRENNTTYALGDLSFLFTGNNHGMAIIFKIGNRSLNPHKKQDIAQLSKASSFDFYEFGAYRLTHAKFTAPNGICKDFQGKQGVKLVMASNYYPQNSFTDFYTALINTKVQYNAPPKEVGYTPSFTGNTPDLQQEIKDVEKTKGRNLALANVKEKASILFNIICK
ncbi:hypothetical protein [Avibacterium avium]|uniref:hypothetical protein n=1 Tax=Avibacterium avium TaxID=751 RepID=UPI003BF79E7B